MKQRFTSVDVRATAKELKQRLVRLRLQNIYDVNSKTFLFKFGKPGRKEIVLIESGTRIHTTEYGRDKSITPSNFCIKLRKHLRARVLTDVRQLGMDRIIDFVFAAQGGPESEGTYHIISEYYALGNIILTDHEYKILSLLRIVSPDESTKFAVGHTYDITNNGMIQDLECPVRDDVLRKLRGAAPKDTLKRCLGILGVYGPAVTESIIRRTGLDPGARVSAKFDELSAADSPQLDSLLWAYREVYEQLSNMDDDSTQRGYITLLPGVEGAQSHGPDGVPMQATLYNEFHPMLLEQFRDKPYNEYPSFMAAVDEFYSHIEAQRLHIKAYQQETLAMKKLQAIQAEHESRVEGLAKAQETADRQARLIEQNLDFVDQAILLFRNAVASGLDWKELEDLVQQQRQEGHPIAMAVKQLRLDTNRITLVLDDENHDGYDDSSDEEEELDHTEAASRRGPLAVDVDISTSAYANAQRYYNSKKQAVKKHEKTVASSAKVVRNAEYRIRQDLKQTKVSTSTISQMRKPAWFEKFLWFITSEGYLVIAGHDMQQNEVLVKRYLKPGDAYVHADLSGAASVIVKNKDPSGVSAEATIPPTTLFQAGIMSVCQSRAWDAKIVTSAWWVEAHQVSKSAPTGEYLTTGSFMIRGRKHFLPPVQLVYGFGFLFKLGDDQSIARHVMAKKEKERIVAENRAKQLEIEAQRSSGKDVPNEQLVASQQQQQQQQQQEEEEEKEAHTGGNDSAGKGDNHIFDDTQNRPEVPAQPVVEHGNFEAVRQKYGLEEYERNHVVSDEDDGLGAQVAKKSGSGHKYMSAKERRMQKKQQRKAESAGGETVPTESAEIEVTVKSKNDSSPSLPAQVSKPKRGKKSKLKKIKEKYGDQDEEDRELRLKLLGTKLAEGALTGVGFGGQRREREARKNDGDSGAGDEGIGQLNLDESAAIKADEEQISETSTAKQGETGKRETEEEKEKDTGEAAEIERIMEEENIPQLDEDIDINILDTFTSNPLPGDTLSFAIPVCAPYPALSTYKYSVKLTPGTMKKGKACKAAVAVFLHSGKETGSKKRAKQPQLSKQDNLSGDGANPSEATAMQEELEAATTARELELIKHIPEMEMIAQMLGKVKVSAPQLEAIQQKQKKNKKAAKKGK